MDEEIEPMAYVTIAPCGCVKYAGVDRADLAKSNAKEMRWAMEHGYKVERVTCQWVRENWRYDCDVCRKPEKRNKRASDAQQVMDI